jgi:N-dimethylarginine dimethylaminohydrolase
MASSAAAIRWATISEVARVGDHGAGSRVIIAPMPRTILMGDPAHFSVRGGANPHTRNILGIRKKVDADRAREQWHKLARTLIAYGTEVCVVEPDPQRTGLVYPANAGFLYPLETVPATVARKFYLAHLLRTRYTERDIYRAMIQGMGYATVDIGPRFEGEADFFPAGGFMIFTHGRVERQRFVPRFGLPPWRRVYGFRSELAALEELREIVAGRPILPVELILEAHYHGDTALCSFGPEREFLLAYLEGLSPESRDRLRASFADRLIPLSIHDAVLYAANSYQTDCNGRPYLFMPEGVSDGLLREVQTRGVEPVLVNVSEFLAKGGGSVKCMILDLGPSEAQPETRAAIEFRMSRSYQNYFGYGPSMLAAQVAIH